MNVWWREQRRDKYNAKKPIHRLCFILWRFHDRFHHRYSAYYNEINLPTHSNNITRFMPPCRVSYGCICFENYCRWRSVNIIQNKWKSRCISSFTPIQKEQRWIDFQSETWITTPIHESQAKTWKTKNFLPPFLTPRAERWTWRRAIDSRGRLRALSRHSNGHLCKRAALRRKLRRAGCVRGSVLPLCVCRSPSLRSTRAGVKHGSPAWRGSLGPWNPNRRPAQTWYKHRASRK